MLNETLMPRRWCRSKTYLWRILYALFVCIVHLRACNGQNYFFEEIKEVNNNFDVEPKTTRGLDYRGHDEPHITSENATLHDQQEDHHESVIEKIKFPEFYHAQGIISLPYDGIIEPFEAWYAGKHRMSRIDYYYGNPQCVLTMFVSLQPVTHCLPAFLVYLYCFTAYNRKHPKSYWEKHHCFIIQGQRSSM